MANNFSTDNSGKESSVAKITSNVAINNYVAATSQENTIYSMDIKRTSINDDGFQCSKRNITNADVDLFCVSDQIARANKSDNVIYFTDFPQKNQENQCNNVSTGNKVMQTNERDDRQLITELLNEMRSLKSELKRREETSQKLIRTLAEEVLALRNEVRQLIASPSVELDTSLLPPLPFFSLPEFKEFDAKILFDEDMRAQLKCLIQRVGGMDLSTYLKTAIKTIISDELAIDLTWRGTPDKPSVQEFAVFGIIKDICQAKFKTSSVLDINKICQQHILHARDRVNKRQKKN